MRYFVLFIYNDIEPHLHGPYDNEDERDVKARELKREHGNESGIFPMSVCHETEEVYVGWYEGGFFIDED